MHLKQNFHMTFLNCPAVEIINQKHSPNSVEQMLRTKIMELTRLWQFLFLQTKLFSDKQYKSMKNTYYILNLLNHMN
jgi:hypothetical protein